MTRAINHAKGERFEPGRTRENRGEPRRTEENRERYSFVVNPAQGEPRRTEENRGEPRRTEENRGESKIQMEIECDVNRDGKFLILLISYQINKIYLFSKIFRKPEKKGQNRGTRGG
jgi:hypothetical protein